MVKLKDIPSQDGMRTKAVTDYFQPVKQTKTNKNEGKRSENVEIIEFSKEITNDTNDNTKIKINQTEEATKTSKANTESMEEKDEGEDEVAEKKTKDKQVINGIADELDNKDKNKNKNPNKNKNNDNQESYINNETEKATNTEANTETINGESGLTQHVNKFHSDGAVAAKRMEMEEENSEQSTKEAVNASINNYQDPSLDDAWNDNESFILLDETVDNAGKKWR